MDTGIPQDSFPPLAIIQDKVSVQAGQGILMPETINRGMGMTAGSGETMRQFFRNLVAGQQQPYEPHRSKLV
jgi:hypothetical protein